VVNEARTNRVPKDWQSGSRLATAPYAKPDLQLRRLREDAERRHRTVV